MVGGLFEGVVNVTETLMPLKMFHISFLILICVFIVVALFLSVLVELQVFKCRMNKKSNSSDNLCYTLFANICYGSVAMLLFYSCYDPEIFG